MRRDIATRHRYFRSKELIERLEAGGFSQISFNTSSPFSFAQGWSAFQILSLIPASFEGYTLTYEVPRFEEPATQADQPWGAVYHSSRRAYAAECVTSELPVKTFQSDLTVRSTLV